MLAESLRHVGGVEAEVGHSDRTKTKSVSFQTFRSVVSPVTRIRKVSECRLHLQFLRVEPNELTIFRKCRALA